MDRIEEILKEACEGQKSALRKYRETGSGDDAASVHYESCVACERALEAIAMLRASTAVVPAAVRGKRPRVDVGFAAICTLTLGFIGFMGYTTLTSTIWPDTQAEVIADLDDDIVSFKDGRTGLCYYADVGSRDAGLVDCEIVATTSLPPRWFLSRGWHYMDMRTATCRVVLSRRHPADGSRPIVPCDKVSHLFDETSPDGRWRYQRWH